MTNLLTPRYGHSPEKAMTLALTLAQAEKAIREFSADQVDAIMDIDGRTYLLRSAQERLRQNEILLQTIIDNVPDVITVMSRSGVIVSESLAIRRLLGYEPEELVGKNIFDLIYEGDLDQLYSAFFQVVEGFSENATVQFHHPTHDGFYRLVEATLGQLPGNESASVVVSMRPIDTPRIPRTELPSREAALPVVRTRDRFLALIAHELRTPLMPVLLGVAELAEDDRFAEARPVLAMMRRNVEVQTRLIEELTDFALVGEHKVRLRLEVIDLHDVVRFVLEICRSEISDAEIVIQLDLRATESMVVADAVRLQQVMWNLLKNAIKFSSRGSSISIATLDGLPGEVVIAFIDEGIGIAANLLPRIFDAFQQGSISEQRVRGGLGLGLFIAKGLTEAQGGTLSALSEAPGKGSTFRLTLPKAPRDKPILPMETDSQFVNPARHRLPKDETLDSTAARTHARPNKP